MSLSYSEKSIVGGPISEDVLQQIKLRQGKLSKTSYTDQDLKSFNSNTSWIRLYSSVNTKQGDGYTSDLAYKNQLLGGTLYDNALRSGFIPGDTSGKSSYDLSNIFGYVPMPGITSLSIASKNNFGTLRVATLQFKANSVEQLSTFEQLYLRPGFTVLLEWGHSIYFDNNANLQQKRYGIGDSYFSSSDKDQLLKDIKKYKKDSSYNYDAMFGYVKNYEWKLATNGEYDCRLDVVSQGELVESLSTVIFTGIKRSEEDTSELIKDATTMHQLLYGIKDNYLDENNKTEANYLLCLDSELIVSNEKNPLLKALFDDALSSLVTVKKGLDIAEVPTTTEQGRNHYITFSTFLQFINTCFMLKNGENKITKFYVGNEEGVNKTPFHTFGQHFLCNPDIGFIPKQKIASYGFGFENVLDREYDETDILDIFINVDFILSSLNAQINSDELTQKNIFDFVQTILRGIEKAGGFINNLDIHFDEEDGTHYIIDRNVVPEKNILETSVINVLGADNTVRDFSISSNITNKISNMVAISAQVGGTDAGEDLMNLQRWNDGLVDRFVEKKSISSMPEDTKTIDYKTYSNVFTTSYSRIGKEGIFVLKIDKEQITSISSMHKQVMHMLSQITTAQKTTNAPGIIPIELELTLTGISGFKIGEAFVIPHHILPERYSEKVNDVNTSKVGFLITGLNHNIDNNDWVTSITSQMIMLSTKPAEKLIEMQDEDAEEQIEEAEAVEPSTELEFAPPLSPLRIRPGDGAAAEGGTFTANRGTGRKHNAIDFLAAPNTTIKSPIEGIIERISTNYSKNLPGILIKGTGDFRGYKATLGYVKNFSEFKQGAKVKKGQPIGSLVFLGGTDRKNTYDRKTNPNGVGYSDMYLPVNPMQNHLHLKITKGSKPVNPQILYNV